MSFDPSRLYSTLQNTGLQRKDNALYQVLHDLIGVVTSISKTVNISSGSSTTNITNNTIQQLSLLSDDGIDGDSGVPGASGQSGIQGVQGVPGVDGEDFSDYQCFVDFRSLGGIFIPGSIIFAGPGGLLAQNNSNLFWDNTNNRLGIGTSSPALLVDIQTTTNGNVINQSKNFSNGAAAIMQLRVRNDQNDISGFFAYSSGFVGTLYGINRARLSEIRLDGATGALIDNGSQNLPMYFGTGQTTPSLTILGSGLVGIGQTSPATALDVTGVINATTGYRINGAAASGNILKGDGTNFVSSTPVSANIVSVVASTFEKAETGTDANVLTYTTGGADEGLNVQVATDVSALTGTSVVVTVTWKDSNNATATSSITLSGVGDGTINIPINAKASTSVVVSTTFVGVSTAYNISATILRFK